MWARPLRQQKLSLHSGGLKRIRVITDTGHCFSADHQPSPKFPTASPRPQFYCKNPALDLEQLASKLAVMRRGRNILCLAILVGTTGAGNLWAQDEPGPAPTKFITDIDEPTGLHQHARPLDPKEIVLLMGEQIHDTDLDCSHFVQWLFERAGLYYDYAPSRILYAGMEGFERVFDPEPGDLVVWPGHVGIVVDPAERLF